MEHHCWRSSDVAMRILSSIIEYTTATATAAPAAAAADDDDDNTTAPLLTSA